MSTENQDVTTPAGPEWLTIDDVATLLRVSTRTVRRHVRPIKIGKSARYRRQDIEALAKGGAQ